MQPTNSDPYGFIMNSPSKPHRNIGPTGTAGRVALVAGGLIVLIILGIIVSALLSSGDKAQTQRLVEVAQRQTEIIRLSAQADKKTKVLSTRSFALTTRVSMESSQKDVTDLLAKRGVKEKSLNAQLTGAKNAKSDAALVEAEKNNRFDETFIEIINNELTNYQKLLEAANQSANKSEKEVLKKSFAGATTLLAKPAATKTSQPVITDELIDESDDELLTEEEL